MGEEKKEERRNRSVWPWILGIVGLFVLAALLLPLLAQNQALPDSGRPEVGIGGGPNTPVTDFNNILNQDDLSSLMGREVRFSSVPVQEVVDEGLFWIGTSSTQRVLVSSNEGLPSMGQNLNLQGGQTVNIQGQIKELPGVEEMQQRWNLNDSEIEYLQNQGAFIQASDIQVAGE